MPLNNNEKKALPSKTPEVINTEPSKKKKKLKCAFCKKKVGLLGFECKCGKLFCVTHLMAESHNCTYNYKQEQSDKLQKSLIKVVHEKVPVI